MKRVLGILISFFAATGCFMVDEDLSGCHEELELECEMRLVTNVQTEINTVLSLDTDINVATALRTYFKDIFSDHAHDVDLSFYDVKAPMPVLEHFTDIIDANQSSYTLHLPGREYMHLAVANIMDNTQVTLENSDLCQSSMLQQKEGETEQNIVEPHNTGLFTARLPMKIREGLDQTFKVSLYMANCTTALVVDNSAEGTPEISRIDAFTTGFATAFNISDSTYVFGSSPLVRAEYIPVEGGSESCYATVQFPSREPEDVDTKVVVETNEPFISDMADKVLWEWIIYVTLPDGTVTQNRLGLISPLRAGQLKIIKVKVGPGGIITANDSDVGVSVTLNWEPGSTLILPL